MTARGSIPSQADRTPSLTSGTVPCNLHPAFPVSEKLVDELMLLQLRMLRKHKDPKESGVSKCTGRYSAGYLKPPPPLSWPVPRLSVAAGSPRGVAAGLCLGHLEAVKASLERRVSRANFHKPSSRRARASCTKGQSCEHTRADNPGTVAIGAQARKPPRTSPALAGGAWLVRCFHERTKHIHIYIICIYIYICCQDLN